MPAIVENCFSSGVATMKPTCGLAESSNSALDRRKSTFGGADWQQDSRAMPKIGCRSSRAASTLTGQTDDRGRRCSRGIRAAEVTRAAGEGPRRE